LIAFRDYHATTHENGALDPRFEIGANSVKMTPYAGLPSLYLNHSGADIQPAGYWFRNFEYDRERERGLDFREDLFNPLFWFSTCIATLPPRWLASTERRPPT
jgi:glycogen debranching enzyme